MSVIDNFIADDFGICTGSLVLNGVAMTSHAWRTGDLTPLWLPGSKRGTNVIVPGLSGVIPYTHRYTETTRVIPMVIIGGRTYAGGVNSDPWAGLAQNIVFLNSYVTGEQGGDSTIDAELTIPGVGTRYGPVQVVDFDLGEKDSQARCLASLTLNIINGAL